MLALVQQISADTLPELRRGPAHAGARRLGRRDHRPAPRREPARAGGRASRPLVARRSGGRAARWTARLEQPPGCSSRRRGRGGRAPPLRQRSSNGRDCLCARAVRPRPHQRLEHLILKLPRQRVRARSSARVGAGAGDDSTLMKRREFVRVTSAGVMERFRSIVPSFPRTVALDSHGRRPVRSPQGLRVDLSRDRRRPQGRMAPQLPRRRISLAGW